MFIDTILIGRELAALRKRNNLSLEEASKRAEIHPNTLSKYEKDASDIQLGTLEKLLNVYNTDELIFFKLIREYNHSN